MVIWRRKKKPETAQWSRRRRIVSWVLRSLRLVLGSLLVFVLLLLFAFLVGPTRSLLLSAGLGIADSFLPGEVTVGKAAWPKPGRIVLEDLVWVSGGEEAVRDTLVDLAGLDLGLDLAALRAHEGRVDSLVVHMRHLDVPGLAQLFTPGDTTVTEADTTGPAEPGQVPWLEEGCIPGIPAVVLGRFDFRGERLLVAPGFAVDDLTIAARAEAGLRGPAEIVVHEVSGRAHGVLADSTGTLEISTGLVRLSAACRLDTVPSGGGSAGPVSVVLDSLTITVGEASVDTLVAVTGLSLAAAGEAQLVPETNGKWRLVGVSLAGVDLAMTEVVLGDDLEIDDLQLEAEGDLAEGRPIVLKVRHLGAEVSGSAPDSAGVRPWGIRLAHLGLGTAVEVEPKEGGGYRLVGADLDSLNLDLAPIQGMVVEAGWSPEEPLRLDTRGRVARDGQAFVADVDVEFLLPGTHHFPDLLPPDFPHEAFGALAGALAIDGRYDGPRLVGDLALDLEDTPWLESGRCGLHVDGDLDRIRAGDLTGLEAEADSLVMGLYGAAVFLDGGVSGGDIDLTLELAVDDARLARMFMGAGGEGDTLVVGADLSVGGTLERPVLNGWVVGTAGLPDLEVPSFRLDLSGSATDVEAQLEAGGGLVFGGAPLDSVKAFVAGERDTTGVVTADFTLAAWLEDAGLALGGTVGGDSVRTVRLDSLVASVADRSFALEVPATLTLGPGSEDFDLTTFTMSGDPGYAELEGHWSEEDFGLDVFVDLSLGEEILQRFFPAPIWSVEGGVDLSVETELEAGGTPESPEFAGYSRARLIPHRDHPSFGLDLDYGLVRGDTAGLFANLALLSADTLLVEGRALWPGRADLDAGVWVPDKGRNITVDIPPSTLQFQRLNRLMPKEVTIEGSLDFAVDLDIPVVQEGDGGMAGSTLAASASSRYMRINLPNRSRVEMNMDLGVEGSLLDPTVSGTVNIESAFFRIPEIPRSLHPVEGPSLLWAMRDSALAGRDSSEAVPDSSFAVFATPENPYGLQPEGPAFMPEMDLKIVFPSNVRVNGYGMDIELEGDVHVAKGFDEDGLPGPSLSGHVRIRSGSIQFMNRVFTPRRGNVDFTGAVPPDPLLDMLVEATVSGTLVKILVSGRASDPVIDLTSEPEMPEEDVMAVLLFGRPLNDLDTSQRDHMQDEGDPAKELRENLAGLAMVFGTAGLQNQMSNTLGVDMVQLGSDSSGGSTLMVGKFISPQIMVKYNASLEKSGTYFMTLEYTLSRYFKLVTTYGQGDEASGAEVRWSKRY